MRKILLLLALISSSALAADLKPYIEGQLGWSNLNDVDTKAYSGSIDDVTVTQATAKIKYDNSVSGGFEIGANHVGIENLRIGVSFNRMKFDMEKVTGSLALSTSSASLETTGDITEAVRSLGVDLDNSVKLYMANAYYDIKNASAFTPFIGFGVGMADIKNAKDNEFGRWNSFRTWSKGSWRYSASYACPWRGCNSSKTK